jgi:hypothetical protein
MQPFEKCSHCCMWMSWFYLACILSVLLLVLLQNMCFCHINLAASDDLEMVFLSVFFPLVVLLITLCKLLKNFQVLESTESLQHNVSFIKSF